MWEWNFSAATCIKWRLPSIWGGGGGDLKRKHRDPWGSWRRRGTLNAEKEHPTGLFTSPQTEGPTIGTTPTVVHPEGFNRSSIRDAPAQRCRMDLQPIRGEHKWIQQTFDLLIGYWWWVWPWNDQTSAGIFDQIRNCLPADGRVLLQKHCTAAHVYLN